MASWRYATRLHIASIVSVPEESSTPYLFGDLLALARQSWVRQMAERLEGHGYPDYRASDAAVVRRLRRGPLSIGEIGSTLGVTRQAARKVVDGLDQRGYARTELDVHDSRRVNVLLTSEGEAYAKTVVSCIHAINRELGERVDPAQLAAADVVLRAALDQEARARAERVVRPPQDYGRPAS